MSVFVDPLGFQGMCCWGRAMKSCHMFTDGEESELHAFADEMGLHRGWCDRGGAMPHYDLTEGKRIQAIGFGAVEVDRRTTVKIRKQWEERDA